MSSLLAQIAKRRMRVIVQLGTTAVLVGAIALGFIDGRAARAGSILMLGALAVLAVKLTLVLAQRLQRLESIPPPPADSGELRILRTSLDEARAASEVMADEVRRLAAGIEPVIESVAHQEGLIRRSEPAIAEVATMRHEVMYLREAVARLQAESDR